MDAEMLNLKEMLFNCMIITNVIPKPGKALFKYENIYFILVATAMSYSLVTVTLPCNIVSGTLFKVPKHGNSLSVKVCVKV